MKKYLTQDLMFWFWVHTRNPDHKKRFIRNENGTSPIFKILKNRLSLFLKWLAHFLKPKKRIYISDTKSRNFLMYYSFMTYFVNVWFYKLANFLAIAHFVIVFLHINNNNNNKNNKKRLETLKKTRNTRPNGGWKIRNDCTKQARLRLDHFLLRFLWSGLRV